MRTTELTEALKRLEQDGETAVAKAAWSELDEMKAELRKFRNAIDSINTLSGRCSLGHGNECECGYCLIHRTAFNAWRMA